MSGRLVLVVDDNAENRALAEATLEDDAFEVVSAKDGQEAIAAYAKHRPDCILLDIQMPGMDGIAVCERIRALEGGADVAIIFVTAQREVATFDRALAAGGDDFLTKPFRPSELVVRVQTAMRLRALAGERSELFAQVKRQRDDLLRLQLEKEQLSAFLVHDLKNPVNAIELQAERILRDKGATERSRDAAGSIRTETRALMRMILNLLDLSRSDEGRLVANISSVSFSELVATTLDELRLTASATEVTLASEVAEDLTHACDRDLVHRVLANLVDNAIRHTPEGSIVRVSVSRQDGGVELRVSDQGGGVPPGAREHVFARFETGGGARNRGLGLAFCKVAVSTHGGRIWIEDANPGAVFCVSLPDATR